MKINKKVKVISDDAILNLSEDEGSGVGLG